MDHWCAFSLNGKILNFSDGDLTPPDVVTRPGIEQFFFFLFSFKRPSCVFCVWRFVELIDDALGPMHATLVCLYAEQQNLGPDTDDDRCMSVRVDRWPLSACYSCPPSMFVLLKRLCQLDLIYDRFPAGLATVYELSFDSVFSDVHVWDIYSFRPSAVLNKTGERAS